MYQTYFKVCTVFCVKTYYAHKSWVHYKIYCAHNNASCDHSKKCTGKHFMQIKNALGTGGVTVRAFGMQLPWFGMHCDPNSYSQNSLFRSTTHAQNRNLFLGTILCGWVPGVKDTFTHTQSFLTVFVVYKWFSVFYTIYKWVELYFHPRRHLLITNTYYMLYYNTSSSPAIVWLKSKSDVIVLSSKCIRLVLVLKINSTLGFSSWHQSAIIRWISFTSFSI